MWGALSIIEKKKVGLLGYGISLIVDPNEDPPKFSTI